MQKGEWCCWLLNLHCYFCQSALQVIQRKPQQGLETQRDVHFHSQQHNTTFSWKPKISHCLYFRNTFCCIIVVFIGRFSKYTQWSDSVANYIHGKEFRPEPWIFRVTHGSFLVNGIYPCALDLDYVFQHAIGHVTKGHNFPSVIPWENSDFSIFVQNPANHFPINTTVKMLSYKSLFLVIWNSQCAKDMDVFLFINIFHILIFLQWTFNIFGKSFLCFGSWFFLPWQVFVLSSDSLRSKCKNKDNIWHMSWTLSSF